VRAWTSAVFDFILKDMRILRGKIETNSEVEVTRRISKKWKENDNLEQWASYL
jgi:hypothetical protein